MAEDGSAAVVLRVESAKYDDDHPAWRWQVALLRQRLREVDGNNGDSDDGEAAIAPTPLRLSVGPEEADGPTKGVLEMSALVLTSAHVIRAAAVVIREWRKQDTTRSVSLKVLRPNEAIEMDGTGAVGADAAYRALLAALESREDQRPDEDDR
jgi:hypothetical protein